MKEYGGYFFNVDEKNRAFTLTEKIKRGGSFTDVVSSTDWENKKTEIFLISFLGNVTYAALAHKGNRVATGKSLVRFTNFVEILPEIPLQYFENQIESNLKQYFIRSSQGFGKRTPPQTWLAVMELIKNLRPQIAPAIDDLYRIKDENFFLPAKEAKILAEEKDAANIALRIAGFEATEVLNWSPPQTTDRVPSFIDGLKDVAVIEDRMIEHDARVFGSWSYLRSFMVGAVEFRKGDEQLIIINANRGNLEHTLGVDLIYYFEKFDSYLMIQYKRMDNESGAATYRPIDKAYNQEIERLQYLKKKQQQLPFSQNGLMRDYRLNQESIYFKLCPKIIFDASSTEMIKGMYIPFDYWEELLKSPSVRGPQGGIKINYNNVERHINNSLFIQLAQSGWIGSKSLMSNQLNQYIQAALAGDKSLMLAIDKTDL